MHAALVALLLAAPIVVREPVGQNDWEQRQTDPVVRRVASLLAGPALRLGSVTVVPLHARVPSEAGHGAPRSYELARGVTGTFVGEGPRHFVRVTNPLDRAVLLLAGTTFAQDGREVYLTRDAVLPPRFAALLPVAHGTTAPLRGRPYARLPALPPNAIGTLIADPSQFRRSLRSATNGQAYGAALAHRTVLLKRGVLWNRMLKKLDTSIAGTVVGAVFLVGNRPVGAHVFRTHELFMAAAPDLLWAIAVQARRAEERVRDVARLAETGDAHGRALAFLRNMFGAPAESAESYGAGFDVTMRNAPDRVVGQAVVDHTRAPVHIAYYAVDFWPAAGAQPGGGAAPPGRPPDTGGDENAPGVTDRKPRPSVGEKRVRDRKPHPRR